MHHEKGQLKGSINPSSKIINEVLERWEAKKRIL
jgi:hypothetical protein